ncbi:hypothetical protein JHN63_03275 [Streptomyces sp. MBT65]|uniref:hypothetical protein n=1 Tax=Streptomyces sp. MBT65 TaxID=1488395 RepID=UPI001909DF63|nr:hypothetical protein [Streptomyces sp. MBT65]MBK3572859.1 hypothetical protein [Streptomyces sp. MBT65]
MPLPGEGRTSWWQRAKARTAAQHLGAQLAAPQREDPRPDRMLSAGWGTKETLRVKPVEPLLVAEVAVDVSLDTAGRRRHPVRLLCVRTDLTPADTPRHLGT